MPGGTAKYPNISNSSPVLELLCGSGKGMSYFYDNGYRNLTGIEINPVAINIMKKTFPEVYRGSTIINGTLEDALVKMKEQSFSLTYSVYVLSTVHPKSNFIFEHIARITKNYIITLEAENTLS